MTVNNKVIYEGGYYKGKRHGKGKMIYANKDIYEGDWVKGIRHGEGSYVFGATKAKGRGKWVNNVFVDS